MSSFQKGLCPIVKFLSVNGQYFVSEWFKLYQTLTTLPIGSNERERSFSALQRTKTKLRDSLSSTALETAVKFTILKPNVTDDDLDNIVQYFCNYPERAKARNIKIFISDNDEDSEDKTLF
ncbi:unnamed protein product [Rotaria sp. Silwood2]|nr:unnamed protein product [Rotaria sp. Silwood2]CAF4564808.1 unnamed protein product [Rotaria sp. Silwood2]